MWQEALQAPGRELTVSTIVMSRTRRCCNLSHWQMHVAGRFSNQDAGRRGWQLCMHHINDIEAALVSQRTLCSQAMLRDIPEMSNFCLVIGS